MAAVSVNIDVRDVASARSAVHGALPLVHALVAPDGARAATSALTAAGAPAPSLEDGVAAPDPRRDPAALADALLLADADSS